MNRTKSHKNQLEFCRIMQTKYSRIVGVEEASEMIENLKSFYTILLDWKRDAGSVNSEPEHRIQSLSQTNQERNTVKK